MSVEDGIPEGGQATPPAVPAHDWEKDYKELQATYTQSQMRLKDLERYESDPQAYYELGAKHGVQFQFDDELTPAEGGEPDNPYAKQFSAYEQRIAQLEARAQAENFAAGEELFHQDLDTWAEQDGAKLSKADHNAIFGLLQMAAMNGHDITQESAARQVYEAHIADKKAEREALEQEIRESMKRPRVPHTPGSGEADTGTPDWTQMSRSEQTKYMAERAQALSQQ